MTQKTFTAIDFETANQARTSACQIGIVLVKDGEITKEFSSYIKPTPYDFIDRFIDIHNINEATVANAPTFPELWNSIAQYIEEAPIIVAHNAVFDKGVLNACLEHHEINAQIPQYYCTCNNAKKLLPNLFNHRLSTVCNHFNIPLNHHEALSDARGAAKIALKLS